MKARILPVLTLILFLSITVWAQRSDERGAGQRGNEVQRGNEQQHGEAVGSPRANRGTIPPPPERRPPNTPPAKDTRIQGHVNDYPHVVENRWYGHDRPNDPRFRIAHPYPHGRFERFGPQYRYSVIRIDPNLREFWFPGGFYFQIAPWDWPLAADWCWQCGGDDFVVYDDPDHPGWYLVYNVHTGQYVHAQYMGQ